MTDLFCFCNPIWLPNPPFGKSLPLSYKNLIFPTANVDLLNPPCRGDSLCAQIRKFVLINLAIKPQGRKGVAGEPWSQRAAWHPRQAGDTGYDELPARKDKALWPELQAGSPLDDFLLLKLERHVLFPEISKSQLSQEQQHGSGIQAACASHSNSTSSIESALPAVLHSGQQMAKFPLCSRLSVSL